MRFWGNETSRSILVVAALWLSPQAFAAERENFFAPNTARDVLPESVLHSDISGIEFFLPVRKKIEEEEREAPEVSPAALLEQKPEQQFPDKTQELLAKYGSPDEDEPVKTEANAPKTLTAMIEARRAGMEDLAFQYARKHARYLRSLKENGVYMTGLIGKAMVAEGMLPENSWPRSTQYEEQDILLQRNRESEKEKKTDIVEDAELSLGELDDGTRDLLRRAQAAEDADDTKDVKIEEKPKPEDNRAAIRAKLRGIPADPKGQVSVYVFLRLTDPNTLSHLKEIQKLYDDYRADKNVRIVPMSIDSTSLDDIGKMQAIMGISFPVRNAAGTALRLQVRESPTLLFVSETTDKVIRETGFKGITYYDEVIKAIKGGVK